MVKVKQRLRAKKETIETLLRLRDFLGPIEAYLTGGFVRDALLGRAIADVDIVVGAQAMKLAPEMAQALKGKYVALDEVNEIARVVLRRERPLHLDFSTMRGSIEEDLSQRDFTINAIAVDLNDIEKPSAPFIDPFNGRQDLERGVVRAISEEGFVHDPARLLRGPRLAAEFGFSIDGNTKALIQRHHRLIATVAAERVRDELCHLIAAPKAAQSLRLLDEMGLLLVILPELSPTKGAEQPKEHFWDVFEHSVETVAAIEFVLRTESSAYYDEGILAFVPWSSELEQHFEEEISSGHNRKTLLKLAALLHDVSKPATRSMDEKGRIRFLGHAKEGASIAGVIMERLRFSSREKEMVQEMVVHHLRPGQLSGDELPTRRAIYRYFRDTGDVAIDTIFLNLADHLATRGPELDFEEWREQAQKLTYVLEERFREESIVAPPKLLDGHDLIDIFSLTPGPEVGELLEAVREAQAAGDIATREEALVFVQKLLSPKGAAKTRKP
jgi:poly(A) polymerase